VEKTTTQDSTYALGHSQRELERLSRQAQLFEPFTRQLLQQAGIAAGMRVLDVGSGSGDVTFLVAELVGQSGEVIGADSGDVVTDGPIPPGDQPAAQDSGD